MESNIRIGSDKATINSNVLFSLRALEMAERNFDNFVEQKVECLTEDDKELLITELNQIHKVYKSLKLKAEGQINI